jgi:hypothetical protein
MCENKTIEALSIKVSDDNKAQACSIIDISYFSDSFSKMKQGSKVFWDLIATRTFE